MDSSILLPIIRFMNNFYSSFSSHDYFYFKYFQQNICQNKYFQEDIYRYEDFQEEYDQNLDFQKDDSNLYNNPYHDNDAYKRESFEINRNFHIIFNKINYIENYINSININNIHTNIHKTINYSIINDKHTDGRAFQELLDLIILTYNLYTYIQNYDIDIFCHIKRNINIKKFNQDMTNILLQFIENYEETNLLSIYDKHIHNFDKLLNIRHKIDDSEYKLYFFKDNIIDIDSIISKFIDIKEFKLSSLCSNTCEKISFKIINCFSDYDGNINKNITLKLINKAEEDSNIFNKYTFNINNMILFSQYPDIIEAILNKISTYNYHVAQNIVYIELSNDESPLLTAIDLHIPSEIISKIIKYYNNIYFCNNYDGISNIIKTAIDSENEDFLLYLIHELNITFNHIKEYIKYEIESSDHDHKKFLKKIKIYFDHYFRRKSLIKLIDNTQSNLNNIENNIILDYISNEYWMRELSLYL